VLVNISTAPGCLLLREYHEIMEIIRNYAHPDAEVKFGTAEVDGMAEDEIRVTLIATGLGGKKAVREERREQLKVVKNGTDGTAMEVPDFQQDFDKPSVFRARSGRGAPQPVDFSNPSVGDSFDIPAFLRRQAD
jgi:cell division protein FtsZ